jgi:hypothetical protein
MQVRFNWQYRSGLGAWGNGEVVDLPDALVAALGADSPGVVSPYAPEPVAAVTDPQEGAGAGEGERQVTAARNRGRPPGSKNRTARG